MPSFDRTCSKIVYIIEHNEDIKCMKTQHTTRYITHVPYDMYMFQVHSLGYVACSLSCMFFQVCLCIMCRMGPDCARNSTLQHVELWKDKRKRKTESIQINEQR